MWMSVFETKMIFYSYVMWMMHLWNTETLMMKLESGTLKCDIGVNMTQTKDIHFIFTQPSWLMLSFIPSECPKYLHNYFKSFLHNHRIFNDRSVVEKLNCLVQISQPDICNAIWQCVKSQVIFMRNILQSSPTW